MAITNLANAAGPVRLHGAGLAAVIAAAVLAFTAGCGTAPPQNTAPPQRTVHPQNTAQPQSIRPATPTVSPRQAPIPASQTGDVGVAGSFLVSLRDMTFTGPHTSPRPTSLSAPGGW